MSKQRCFVFLLLMCFLPACDNEKNTAIDFITEDTSPLVLFFVNTECPVCQKYQGSFKPLIKRFSTRVRIYFVFEGNPDSNALKAFCDYDSIPYSLAVIDQEGHIAEKAGATNTPQCIIFSSTPATTPAYSGMPDDRVKSLGQYTTTPGINYVENALISLLNHEAVKIPHTTPVGCFIEHR